LNKAAPKLGAIDLNLLVVFDAIMRDRSVTRAGQRLRLSQPAMSHALARLRHMLKDELFVRSPNGMVPMPRTEELATPVRMALEGLQQSLEPVSFEPSKATATFRIAVDNYAAIVLVAPIAAHVARIAPGVTLYFRPSGTLNVLDQLDRSELHLAIGPAGVQGERFFKVSFGPKVAERSDYLLEKTTQFSNSFPGILAELRTVRATILLRNDWLSGLIGALLW